MTPDEIVETLRVASLTHLLAVDAAVTTMRNLPADDPARIALKIGLNNAYGRMGAAYPRRMRSGFTVEETEAILAEHYPWAREHCPREPFAK